MAFHITREQKVDDGVCDDLAAVFNRFELLDIYLICKLNCPMGDNKA